MPKILVAPSILAADFSNLAEEVRKVESAGADWIHCDIMDGHFVDNISFGPEIVARVRGLTSLPLDVHLMIEHADHYVPRFIKAGANSITVHHPLGTCKMGVASDAAAVVDPELRVHGTEGLRVVDGSVMPDLVGAHINAPIIMIAEKAADLIRGRPALEVARLAGATEFSRP